MIIYIDTSALGRVYLGDQSDSAELSGIVYESEYPVITSELTDVEIASMLARAEREGAIDSATRNALLQRYASDTSDAGPIGVVPLDGSTLDLAREFVLTAPLRTLDAIQLAACARFAAATAEEVRLLSRDTRQNDAARTLGLTLVAE